MAVDATQLFWANATAGTIMAQSLSGTGMPSAIYTGSGSPYDLLIEGTSAYWSDSGNGTVSSGSINKVATSGGTPTLLATGQNSPECIAVDTTSIYWINVGGGAIKKTAR